MTKYSAFLRAINLGKKNKIPMKELKKIFQDKGCTNVKTFLNSGNVIFEYEDKIKTLTDELEEDFQDFGTDIYLFVRPYTWLSELVFSHPFGTDEVEENKVWYITFCNSDAELSLPHISDDGLNIFKQVGTDYLTIRTLTGKPAISPNPIIEKNISYATTRGWKTILRMVN